MACVSIVNLFLYAHELNPLASVPFIILILLHEEINIL